MQSVMREAGLSRPYPVFTLPAWGWAENPYGPFRGLRWSLIFIILWIRRSSSQHMCNFPVILPSCLELWVMCFKSSSGVKWLWTQSVVWTRPVCFHGDVGWERENERVKVERAWDSGVKHQDGAEAAGRFEEQSPRFQPSKECYAFNTGKALLTALVAYRLPQKIICPLIP